MADQNQPEIRHDSPRTLSGEGAHRLAVGDTGSPVPTVQNPSGEYIPSPDEIAEHERAVEAEAERQRLEAIDSREIVAGGHSTTVYRRAVALFDPDDPDLQPAENWVFQSETFAKYGRF